MFVVFKLEAGTPAIDVARLVADDKADCAADEALCAMTASFEAVLAALEAVT